MSETCIPPEPIRIHGKRRHSTARSINVSLRVSEQEFQRLHRRATVLRTDVSKLIRSRLDDILSVEHVCEVCQQQMNQHSTSLETDGKLFENFK